MKEREKKIDVKQPNMINYLQSEYGKGVDLMDQNISSYMMNLWTKIWWWPLFHFCIDISVNNAFQIYRERDLQPGEIQLDLLGFRTSVVETYSLLFRNKEAPSTLYKGNRSSEKVPEHIRTYKQQHWIAKGNQRR